MNGSRIAALAALLVAALLVFAEPAAATITHEEEGTFALSGLDFLAVDNSGGASAGDLYIGEFSFETSSSRVYQADPSGAPTGVELNGAETPAGSFGLMNSEIFKLAGSIAVDDSAGANAGDVYVPDIANGVVDRFDETGKYLCQITGKAVPSASECAGLAGSETPTGKLEPQSVAVDPRNGRIAVGDASGVIYLFNSKGEFEGEIADASITEPFSIAFDSTGSLYVVNANLFGAGAGSAVKFDSTGAFEYALPSSHFSVGIDLGDDHVYLGNSLESSVAVEELDSAGAPVSSFGSGGVLSVGVNASDGRVYLGGLGEGQIWSGDILLPTVLTGEATAVSEGSATLHGSVDPEPGSGGTPVERCEFEYGESASYGHTAPCSPVTPYASATPVEAAIGGLASSSTYHYRLVAENAEGRVGFGEDRTFTTFGAAGISEETAIARTTSATVRAQINPFGFATSCEVQFVDDATFDASGYASASTVSCGELAGAFEAQAVSVALTGLRIGTGYHYRFIAHNQAGTSVGEEQTFSTFGIRAFTVEALDQEGEPYVQAGGHPYEVKVSFSLTTTLPLSARNPSSVPANLRTVEVQLPPGLIGNPTATPLCPPAEMKPNQCPETTQVGMATVTSARGASEFGPVYNLVSPQGVAAELGTRFNAFGSARIDAGVRTGSDYGVNADSLFVSADEGIETVEVILWGVPADEGHFGERFCRGEALPGCASEGALLPFLTTPTSCLGPLQSGLRVDAWQDPGEYVSASAPLPGTTGCGGPHFDPTLEVEPEVHVTDSPAGLHVHLHVPQNQDPGGLAEANLKDAAVTLPEGLVVNPAGANGLAACSPAEIELNGPKPANCPDASKVGSLELDTPLLDHPIEGGIFVAQQGNAGPAWGENPFGSLLAIYLAAADPHSGVVVKLAGRVEPNPRTGRLTTVFSDNPQLPFEDLRLDFFGGPAAVLSTPTTCGRFTTSSDLVPWTSPAGATAHPSSGFEITGGAGGGPCTASEAEQPNSPGFEAGTADAVAGAFSPFLLRLSRPDGSQRFAGIETALPEGLLARLQGIPYCSGGAIAASLRRNGPGGGVLEQTSASCPPASRVGSVEVEAGTGPQPLPVRGSVYLAGPYQGAPLSLVVVTPVLAGPFDLGTVTIRVGLYVDPETTRVTAKSDPLPTILEGIPLDIRSITLRLDRSRFILNPTSCNPSAVTASVSSVVGRVAPLSDRFQVGGCQSLPFAPRLSLRLFGRTRRNAKPRLRAILTAPAGEANLARVRVNLPHSEFLEQAHIRSVCTRVQFVAGQLPGEGCPGGSVYGHARAVTPLLDQPLKGPVYLRSSSHKLPDLVAALRGQVNVVVAGKIDSGPNHGLRTTFAAVPDAPISKFILEMRGGGKGLLVNSEDLCARRTKARAIARLTGQNGKVLDLRPKVKNACRG